MLSNEKIVDQIQEALEELRPYFFMHGGDISLVSFEAGKVSVKLSGACSGCPSSSYTLKLLVEDTLKREVPQVKEVIEA